MKRVLNSQYNTNLEYSEVLAIRSGTTPGTSLLAFDRNGVFRQLGNARTIRIQVMDSLGRSQNCHEMPESETSCRIREIERPESSVPSPGHGLALYLAFSVLSPCERVNLLTFETKSQSCANSTTGVSFFDKRLTATQQVHEPTPVSQKFLKVAR